MSETPKTVSKGAEGQNNKGSSKKDSESEQLGTNGTLKGANGDDDSSDDELAGGADGKTEQEGDPFKTIVAELRAGFMNKVEKAFKEMERDLFKVVRNREKAAKGHNTWEWRCGR